MMYRCIRPADKQFPLLEAPTGLATLPARAARLDNLPGVSRAVILMWVTCHQVDCLTRVIGLRTRPVYGHPVTVVITGAVMTREASDSWNDKTIMF